MRRPLLLLAAAGLELSLACTDGSPTRPDAAILSSATQETGASAAETGRPVPRVVAARTPLGPTVRLLTLGSWGSAQSSGLDNYLLTVEKTGAALRSECSNGVIEGAIVLDAAGHFDVLGTYQIQAGPTRPPRPARFVGLATGQTLTFTVLLTQDNQIFGPFTLTFGLVPKIGYCPIV